MLKVPLSPHEFAYNAELILSNDFHQYADFSKARLSQKNTAVLPVLPEATAKRTSLGSASNQKCKMQKGEDRNPEANATLVIESHAIGSRTNEYIVGSHLGVNGIYKNSSAIGHVDACHVIFFSPPQPVWVEDARAHATCASRTRLGSRPEILQHSLLKKPLKACLIQFCLVGCLEMFGIPDIHFCV